MKTLRSGRRVSGEGELEGGVFGSSSSNNNGGSQAARLSVSPTISIKSKVTEEAMKVTGELAIIKSTPSTAKQSTSGTVMSKTAGATEVTPKGESNGINSTDGKPEQGDSNIKLTDEEDEGVEEIPLVKDKPILFSTGVRCDTFHGFALMPIELREEIWKYTVVVEQGRIVQIKLDVLGDPWKAISKTYVPAILHVCSDARKFALPYYYLLKCDDNHMSYGFRHTYINWETDALFFRTPNTAHQFLHGVEMDDPSVQDDEPYYDALGRLVDTSGYDVWDGEKFIPPIPADAMAPDSRGRRFPNEITIRKRCKKVIVPIEAVGEVIHPQHQMNEFLFFGMEELYFVLDIPLNTIRMDFIETNLREVARDDVRLQNGQRYEREGENEDISCYYENVLHIVDKKRDKLNRRKQPVKVKLMDFVNAGKKRRN
ncbi:hypothetical protein BJ875DRAFT_497387 [Amylocarpus encephaloides]|uniref:2EXR domain-containing protein n=1 Tax=Amylocarpus encephaloides TaxID=45428 RepID=A0A9P8C3I0_9HELO|nr:hypothetical protein BJ875DRAFT_497387 [Amylocarpus encephaloides]